MLGVSNIEWIGTAETGRLPKQNSKTRSDWNDRMKRSAVVLETEPWPNTMGCWRWIG